MERTGWGWRTRFGANFRVWSPEMHDNVALFDPYTFAHAFGGSGIQFFLIPPAWIATGFPWWQLFLLNLALHALFEVFENSPLGIRLIHRFFDESYEGDSAVNSAGDLFAFCVSYGLAIALFEAGGLAAAATLPLAALSVFAAFWVASSRRVGRA